MLRFSLMPFVCVCVCLVFIYKGTILDRIDYNVEQALTQVKEGVQDVEIVSVCILIFLRISCHVSV